MGEINLKWYLIWRSELPPVEVIRKSFLAMVTLGRNEGLVGFKHLEVGRWGYSSL